MEVDFCSIPLPQASRAIRYVLHYPALVQDRDPEGCGSPTGLVLSSSVALWM